jgi:purine-binding chemotaxis protein CheW
MSETAQVVVSGNAEVLRRRTQRYAARADGMVGDGRSVVHFNRGGDEYAVPLVDLREIRPLRKFCRIPGASPAVPGVLHYRGEILSGHDLEACLRSQSAASDAAWVLVVERNDRRLGLLADDIIGVELVRDESVKPTPVTFGERVVILDGVIGGNVLLLNTGGLFSDHAFYFAFPPAEST